MWPQHFSQRGVFSHSKNHSYDREEVESYSCQFIAWRSSVNSGLQNGYKNSLAYFRAIQGHSRGITIDPALMGHILIRHNWKEFIFHRGCSFSIRSILENGLISGGRESDKGRQTVFFPPLDPSGGDSDEEEHRDDYTVPQKVHHHSHWKHNQDAVCWVKLSRAQDQGLQFWQTKSHAIMSHSPVPAGCIF